MSFTHPRSAVTFSTLNLFHLLTLQGKVTAYDFYYSLVHQTDNWMTDPPKVCTLSLGFDFLIQSYLI
jgi:hypothetical protein